jgi:mono/diheme cytochrome c family protein
MTRLGRMLVVVLVLGGPSRAWAQGAPRAPRVSAQEYEGWRQYSAQCARCHGQDVLGNPVAADLLKSVGPGGPMAEKERFVAIVKNGRADHGMPGFAKVLTDEQVDAIYAYVKGRADGKILAGRPEQPKG